MPIPRGYIKILAAAFIWGTLGAFSRWSGMTPVELSFYRMITAGLTLSFILPRQQRLIGLGVKQGLLLFLGGALFAADCLLFFHAVQLTTLSNAVFPYSTQPVLIAALGPLFLKAERVKGYAVAFYCSLGGLLLLLYPSLVLLSGVDALGIALAFAGTLCLTLIVLITRVLSVNAMTFVYYKMLIAALFLLPLHQTSSPISASAVLWGGAIGVIHTALAYMLYYDGLKDTNLQTAVILTYFAPAITALCGFIFFDEALTLFALAGGGLIVFSGLIVLRLPTGD